MSEQLNLDEIKLQWEGSHEVFDDYPLVETIPKTGFELRTMLSTKGASLKDIVLGFCGYMTIYDSNSINETPYGQLLLALCAVILVNPFEIKILSGKGIDPLIDSSEFDQDTGERFILKTEFIKYCNNHDIPLDLITWLEQKNLAYQNQDRILFKRNLKKGKIFQKI